MRALTRLKRSLRKRALFRKFGEQWIPEGEAFQKRRYDSYDAYLEHQKAKLETHEFGQYDQEFRRTLRERLTALAIEWQGRNVLCLAARIGTEVKAFLDLGAFAVGIDLNPGKENRYVVHGDFHELQYAPDSIDVVYTNSLDHVFDIDRLAKEVLRVLKPDGLFLVEAGRVTTRESIQDSSRVSFGQTSMSWCAYLRRQASPSRAARRLLIPGLASRSA
jgi:SAM-dependent methyltransferase